ncbi:MAG TPA: hypothetical protein VGN63_13925 [Flavisolibacter sp.]|jgi:amino acid transporter|nr:hypothetical protein [Flavisolibacter sp.]
MEILFRLFMYIFPYAVSLALYIWIFRKALKVPHKSYRIAAIVIVAGGLAYTLYEIATTITKALTDDNFHFAVLIVTIIVLFFASMAMAFGEPEK